MISVRFQNAQKIPLSTRILMVLGGIAALAFLFFFASAIVIIALIGVAIAFVARLFMGKPQPVAPPTNPHHRPTQRDDDVIDI